MILNKPAKLVISLIVSLAAGAIGSVFTAGSVDTWYQTLAKPTLNPPSWVFGPVWTVLYILIGIALFLIWQKVENSFYKNNKKTKTALRAFAVQLFLNTTWSIIFFGLQNPGAALVNIILLWLAIVWTMFTFHKVSKPAAWLLTPYILWVSFATYLNYSIWLLN